MTEPIEIPIVVTGSEVAVSGMRSLSGATEGVATAQQAAATSSIALVQRVAGAASAVQGLVGQLGGGSRTAGLVGATLQTSAQFAQLGAALGPQGALVGGIVGAAIPAFSALREEMVIARSTIDDTVRSIDQLTASYVAAREAAELQARLASGTASLEEATNAATQAQARYDDEAQRHATLLREQLAIAEEEYAQAQRMAQLAPHQALIAHDRVEAARQEVEANERLVDTLRQEAEARTKVAEEMERQAAAQSRLETAVRTGNDHNADRARIRRREGATGPTAEESIGDAIAGARQRQEEAARIAAEQAAELTQKQNDLLAEQIRLREENQAKIQASADADEAYFSAAQERDEARLEALGRDQDQQLAAMAAHQQQVTAQAEQTASQLIGSMTEVIAQIAEGNATAEEGAQLMLAAFLQALSQRAQIEALAQVAMAISSYPDVAGIAAHVAGALAWGAVAVATGVGGAAISSGVSRAQAARQEAERPASPRSEAVKEGGGGGTTIINFNQPVVTAQGNAQLGRIINGASDAARQRFAS